MHSKYFVLGASVLLAQALPSAAQVSAQPLTLLSAQRTSPIAIVSLTLEQAVEKTIAANPILRAAALDKIIQVEPVNCEVGNRL